MHERRFQGLSLFDELPVAPRWRQSSAKAPRSLHEATMAAPRATTEAPRRLHEAAVKPSQLRRLHKGLVNAPRCPRGASILWILRCHHGCFTEPSWSLCGAFNSTSPQMQPQLPKGRFHSESVIPSAHPCVVSVFGLWLGLGFCLLYTSPSPRDA